MVVKSDWVERTLFSSKRIRLYGMWCKQGRIGVREQMRERERIYDTGVLVRR